MNKVRVHLGYEVETGEPVTIPLRNMVVTGVTQEAGKTTTMEALIGRAGVRAIAFITKRSEQSFTNAIQIPPFFSERADWVFVSSLIDATMGEKNKMLRAWLMKVCRGAKTLAEVHQNVKANHAKARGFAESIYEEINGYLDLVVPQLAQLPPATEINIGPGINAVDVSQYSVELQSLVIRSYMEHINKNEEQVVTIVPEAWEFIPQGRGNPVKVSARELLRKGSGIGNYIWFDSQDLRGIDKEFVGQSPVILMGFQREANEVKRSLANLHGLKKPKADDIASMGLGQFYACWREGLVKTYVQPEWMSSEDARAVAMGLLDIEAITRTRAVRARLMMKEETTVGTASPIDHKPFRPLLINSSKNLKSSTNQPHEGGNPGVAAAVSGLTTNRVIPDVEPRNIKEPAMPTVEELERQKQDLDRQIEAKRAAKPAAIPGDFESLYQAIKARLIVELPRTGGPITVTPPEKLRLDFQRQESDRIIAAAKELPALSKRVLKLLEAMGDFVSQKTIAERLGRAIGGGSWIDLGKAIKQLVDEGFAEVKERQGTRKALRAKIAADLAFYQAADADVEAVYQNVLFLIASEA